MILVNSSNCTFVFLKAVYHFNSGKDNEHGQAHKKLCKKRLKKKQNKRKLTEEKQKQQQYGQERYKNLPELEKQRLVEYSKNIKCRKIKTLHNKRLVLKMLGGSVRFAVDEY